MQLFDFGCRYWHPVPRQQIIEHIDLIVVNAIEHVGEIGLAGRIR